MECLFPSYCKLKLLPGLSHPCDSFAAFLAKAAQFLECAFVPTVHLLGLLWPPPFFPPLVVTQIGVPRGPFSCHCVLPQC